MNAQEQVASEQINVVKKNIDDLSKLLADAHGFLHDSYDLHRRASWITGWLKATMDQLPSEMLQNLPKYGQAVLQYDEIERLKKDLQQCKDDAATAAEHYATQLQDAMKKVDEYNKFYETSTGKIKTLQRALDQCRIESRNIDDQRVAEKETLERKITGLTEAYSRDQENCRKQIADLTEDRDYFKARANGQETLLVSHLRIKIDNLASERNELTSQIADLVRQRDGYKEFADKQQAGIAEIQKELRGVFNELRRRQ